MGSAWWTDYLDAIALGDRTEYLRGWHGQIRRSVVSLCLRPEFMGKMLEAGRGGETKDHNGVNINREGVRNATRGIHEAAGSRLQRVVTHEERHLSIEDVPSLVLVMVNVKWWLGGLKGHCFHQCKPVFGVRGTDLCCEPSAQRPHRCPLPGPEQKRLSRVWI